MENYPISQPLSYPPVSIGQLAEKTGSYSKLYRPRQGYSFALVGFFVL